MGQLGFLWALIFPGLLWLWTGILIILDPRIPYLVELYLANDSLIGNWVLDSDWISLVESTHKGITPLLEK